MEYVLVGVVKLFSLETCKIMGYNIKDNYFKNVALCYSKDGKLDEGLLFTEIQETNKFKYIPSHLINEKISLEEGKKQYPELFL